MKQEDIAVVGIMINMELFITASTVIGFIALFLGIKVGVELMTHDLYNKCKISKEDLNYLLTYKYYFTLLKKHLFGNDEN